MTQTEFRAWIESILADMPMEEFVAPEILEHMNRVHLDNEQRGWNYAREGALEAFQVTVRSMVKTMFAIGFDAGREQASVDALMRPSTSQPSQPPGDVPPGEARDDNNLLIV